MSDLDESRVLLAAALIDLETLERMVAMPPFPDRAVGFHAQQCIEKCLKAWLALCGVTYPTIHSIRRLVQEVEAAGESAAVWRGLSRYGPYAGWLRYGDARAEETLPPLDHARALAEARNLYNHVVSLFDTASGADAVDEEPG
jgi:HEPN domain-containing protein